MPRRYLVCAVCMLGVLGVLAEAQVNETCSFQGVLTDTIGVPKPDGLYSLTFRLYDVELGGSALWSEVHAVQVERGLFHVLLGSLSPFAGALSFDRPYWLSVQEGAGAELEPRLPLSAVAYSFHTLKADTASYAHIAPQQGVVDSARVAGTVPPGSIGNQQLAAAAVTRAKIAPGQVVKSINSLREDVTLVAGANVMITTSGDTLTIAAAGAGIGGSGARDEIAVWGSGGTTLTSDPDLTTALMRTLSARNPFSAGKAVYGEASGTSGDGVYGLSTYSGENYVCHGVYGQAASTSGRGTYGLATSTTGVAVGAMGVTYSSQGYGVYGVNTSGIGVNGRGAAGVWGYGTEWGVRGLVDGETSRALYGTASSSVGINYAVYAQTNSTSGYAGYFKGGRNYFEGTVGIGTETPGSQLEVRGEVAAVRGTGPNLIIRDADGSNSRPGISFENNNIQFIGGDDQSNEVFSITSQFGSTRTYDAEVWIHGRASGSWGNYLGLTHDGTNGKVFTDAGHVLLSPASGRVGVGVTDPVQSLHVSGKIRTDGISGLAGGLAVKVFENTLYYQTSSSRFKDHITDLEDRFEKILDVRPVQYRDRVSGTEEIGVIAEELEAQGLEKLLIYADGRPLAVKYEMVSLYLLEVVKQQRAMLNDLRDEVEQLRSTLR